MILIWPVPRRQDTRRVWPQMLRAGQWPALPSWALSRESRKREGDKEKDTEEAGDAGHPKQTVTVVGRD